jgi:hypothetical protein
MRTFTQSLDENTIIMTTQEIYGDAIIKSENSPNKRKREEEAPVEVTTPTKKFKADQPVNPSPIKVHKRTTPILLEKPSDHIEKGISRKLFEGNNMIKEVKHSTALANEVIFSKFLRQWYSYKENTKELSPQNGLVVHPENDSYTVSLVSVLIEGFNTIYSINEGQNLKSTETLRDSPGLWQKFLINYSTFYMLLRNPDLHSRNLGYTLVNGEKCIAAVDFEQAFLLGEPKNPKDALFEFLHVLHYWHKIKYLNPNDIKTIYNALENTYNEKENLIESFKAVIAVAIRDCNETIKSSFPTQICTFIYSPNNIKQKNPLLQSVQGEHLRRFKSFQEYCTWLTQQFSSSAAKLPEFLEELEPHLKFGIEIEPFLHGNRIDVNIFKKHKAVSEAKTQIYISPNM